MGMAKERAGIRAAARGGRYGLVEGCLARLSVGLCWDGRVWEV
jgi:hypothetical protein